MGNTNGYFSESIRGTDMMFTLSKALIKVKRLKLVPSLKGPSSRCLYPVSMAQAARNYVPPGQDASLSQVNPPAFFSQVPILQLGRLRQ